MYVVLLLSFLTSCFREGALDFLDLFWVVSVFGKLKLRFIEASLSLLDSVAHWFPIFISLLTIIIFYWVIF